MTKSDSGSYKNYVTLKPVINSLSLVLFGHIIVNVNVES